MGTLRYAAAAVCFPAPGDAKRPPTEQGRQRLQRFEKQVEQIRRPLKIPGRSAVIVRDQQVLWSKGFGFGDADKQFPATLVLQPVEQGKL